MSGCVCYYRERSCDFRGLKCKQIYSIENVEMFFMDYRKRKNLAPYPNEFIFLKQQFKEK